MYQTNNGNKFTEQDIFNEGCIPETAQGHEVDMTFSNETTEGIIEEMRDFFDVDDDALQLDACDETGRIDIALMETDESEQASKIDIEQWKQGKKRLWSSIYTFYVFDTVPVSLVS